MARTERLQRALGIRTGMLLATTNQRDECIRFLEALSRNRNFRVRMDDSTQDELEELLRGMREALGGARSEDTTDRRLAIEQLREDLLDGIPIGGGARSTTERWRADGQAATGRGVGDGLVAGLRRPEPGLESHRRA